MPSTFPNGPSQCPFAEAERLVVFLSADHLHNYCCLVPRKRLSLAYKVFRRQITSSGVRISCSGALPLSKTSHFLSVLLFDGNALLLKKLIILEKLERTDILHSH